MKNNNNNRLKRKLQCRTVRIAILLTSVLLLSFGLVSQAYGQKTWDGGASTTNWGDANNWNPNGLPSSTDNVTIIQSQTINVNIAGAVCNNLLLSPTGNGTATLTFSSGGILTSSGTVTLGQSGSSNRKGALTMTNGGTLICKGFTLANSGSNTFTPGSGSVQLTTGNNLPATIFTTFNNLTISGGTTTMGVALTINGSLNISSGATLNTTSNNFQLTLGGDYNNNGGTLNTYASPVVIAGTMAAQSIDGFSTTGAVSMTKTGGTATLAAAVNGGSLVLNGSGGTLNTGNNNITTSGALTLSNNAIISLGSNSHTLTFGDSHATTWAAGTTLTINGWSGNWDGTAGTVGRIFIGSNTTGLTSGQLAQIRFFDSATGTYEPAVILSSGEVVPTRAAPSVLSYSTPNTYTKNIAITSLNPTVSGYVSSYSVSPSLPAGLTLNTTTGVISGTPSIPTPLSTYTVTASNVAGSTTTGVNITVLGTAFFSIANGNWNSNTTWALSSGGSAVAAGIYPMAGDIVTIEGTSTTVTVTADANCASISFTAASRTTNLNINSGISLTVSGIVTIPRASVMNTIAVGAGNLNAGSISFTNSGSATRHRITITNGTVTVSGDVTIDNAVASASIIFTGTGVLKVGGQLMSSGTVGGTLTTVAGCEIEYNGAGAQAAKVAIYNGNLTLSGSGIKTFATTPTVNGILSMEGAATVVVTSTGVITYGTNATLQYNTSSSRTASLEEWLPTFNATGGVIIAGSGTITLNDAKIISASSRLIINSGAVMTVNSNTTLTVNGVLTNNAGNGGLILQSDATGTASLIHNSNNVAATVNRYITGSPEAWHLLSSPVSAQSISGTWLPSGTYGNSTGYDLYVWNEQTSCWIYNLNTTTPINWNTVHPESSFVAGRGYLYSVQATNPVKQFTGNLNNGNQSIPLTAAGADLALHGFNLAGNPYASSIDWQASSGWTRSNLETSGSGYDMWIWNPATGNYGVVNSAGGAGTNGVTRNIAPMQAFFVMAAASGNLQMTNSVRVHTGAASWLKSSEVPDVNMISINVKSEDGEGSDEILLLFGSEQEIAGARKLFSPVATAPSLYLPVQDGNFSVRYLTDTIENPVVPIKFKSGSDGLYSLQCDFDVTNFETVILEDRKKNSFHDMKLQNEYLFTGSKTDNQSRFLLHFSSTVNEGNYEMPAVVYVTDNQLMIDLTAVQGETEIMIYDLSGRLLTKETLQGETLHNLNINSRPQILIIRLSNNKGSSSKKVMWVNA